MKRKTVLSFLLFTVFALCVAVSCTDEDDPYYSSKRQLLGKWELVAFGNSWNNMIVVQKPGGYYEYLSDNTIRHFSYETQKYDSIKSAYYMDSLLHVGSIAYNDSDETGCVSPMYTVFKVKNNCKFNLKYNF